MTTRVSALLGLGLYLAGSALPAAAATTPTAGRAGLEGPSSRPLGSAACEPSTPPWLTIFLVDGLEQSVFQRELAQGRLPEIGRLAAEGAYFLDGISAFPSMTGYGFYPFLTGRDATTSGVLGLRWFDRRRERGNLRSYVGRTLGNMNGDLVAAPRTLYEEFPTQCSSVFNTYLSRGARRQVNNGRDFSMAKYRDSWWLARFLSWLPFLGRAVAPDWKHAESRILKAALADRASRPKIQWITFSSPDGYSHVHGHESDEYSELLRHIDRLIGRYREAAQRDGSEAERIYAVLSDHGVAEVRQNLDLREVFEAKGLKAFRGAATALWSGRLDKPLKKLEGTDVMVVVNGNLMNYLYLRNPALPAEAGWRAKPRHEDLFAYPLRSGGTLNVVEALQKLRGVELVVIGGRLAQSVEVYSRSGMGQIVASNGGFSYAVEAVDPLDYLTDEKARPLVDGRPHSADEWLSATHRSRYPYAVVRLAHLFAAPQVGDIVVTSEKGFDLARNYELFVSNYRGGHGGLRADTLRVPYVLWGKGVKPGVVVDAARAEDLGRSLRALLGLPRDSGRDDGQEGRVLLEALQPELVRRERASGAPDTDETVVPPEPRYGE